MTTTPSGSHTATIAVRWSDFDRFGHLNNAAYIELAQEARNVFAFEEFLGRGHDVPAVFIRHLEVDYLKPILPDTMSVIVETVVTHVGDTSFTTEQTIYDRSGAAACVVRCVQIAVDLDTSTPRAITTKEAKILTRGSSDAAAAGK